MTRSGRAVLVVEVEVEVLADLVEDASIERAVVVNRAG
jgi:hypothetical protein